MTEHEENTAPQEEIEVDFVPEEELGDLGAAQAKLKKLREELKEAQKKRDEYLDGWQRCKADSINARKDMESRATRAAELLREALVHDIIPALDSFDLATQTEAWAEVSDGWKSGMEQVRDQLIEALRAHGIERFGKVGEPLDHVSHEAIQEIDGPGEPHTILKIVRYGYRTKDRVLRPAQVFVKK